MKTKHIRIEEHIDGDRLAQTASDGDKMLAMIAKCRKIAKYAENGTLEMRAEAVAITLTEVAAFYGFIDEEETTNDDTPPTLEEVFAEQTPGTEVKS